MRLKSLLTLSVPFFKRGLREFKLPEAKVTRCYIQILTELVPAF